MRDGRHGDSHTTEALRTAVHAYRRDLFIARVSGVIAGPQGSRLTSALTAVLGSWALGSDSRPWSFTHLVRLAESSAKDSRCSGEHVISVGR